jgi:hypothetical protein
LVRDRQQGATRKPTATGRAWGVAAEGVRTPLTVVSGHSQPTIDTRTEEKAMSEGKFDEAKGRVKEAVGEAADKMKDAVNPDR